MLMFVVGFPAFVYAHYHAPGPEVDPMAVKVLSPTAYDLLHYGGIGLMIVAAALFVSALWRAR